MLARPIYATCLGTQQQSAFRLAFKTTLARSPSPSPSAATAAAGASIRGTSRRSFASVATTTHPASSSHPTSSSSSSSSSIFFLLAAGGASLAAASAFRWRHQGPIRCDASTAGAANTAGRPYAEMHTPSVQGPGSAKLTSNRPTQELPPVESALDLRSLSFGAVAGISTGIFIRKGLSALGFLLGGAFVFLQYLASRGMVNVDWRTMASRYESKLESLAGAGTGTRLQRLGNRALDFLMADFPPRATFAAGLALGLRLG